MAGRPRKVDVVNPTADEKRLEDKRKYMRTYKANTNVEIIDRIDELEKMEKECEQDLARVLKHKKKLINELEKANKQAESIIKEINTPVSKKGSKKKS